MGEATKIIEYPQKMIQAIGCDENIVKLLTNNPSIDIDGEEADSVFDKYLFNYIYVDETTDTSEAYICVEAELENTNTSTSTIADFMIYVDVICHKDFMQLSYDKFPGIAGNRRDNLVVNISRILQSRDIALKFGIGKIDLESIKTIPSPKGFTSRELTWHVSAIKN